MGELVLYELSSSSNLIIIFLITFFILGIIVYWLMNKVRLKKGKVKIYGLLLEIDDANTLVLSASIIRVFLIIYYILVFQENVTISLVMIGIISVIYIICSMRNMFYEILNTVSILAVVYFIHTLNNYLITVTYSSSVQIIKTVLIAFTVMYAIYLLLRSVEEIVENNMKKEHLNGGDIDA